MQLWWTHFLIAPFRSEFSRNDPSRPDLRLIGETGKTLQIFESVLVFQTKLVVPLSFRKIFCQMRDLNHIVCAEN